MPADFESGFFVGEKAWHGLGTTLPADTHLSVFDGLVAAGMNWDVYLKPAAYRNDAGEYHVPMTIPKHDDDKAVPMHYFTMRRMERGGETVEDVLGCVGKRYTPLQNHEAFDWFNPWIEQGHARLHTAGSLCDGRKVWILAQLTGDGDDIGNGDKVLPFLMLSSSHDGSNAVRVGFTPIRIVCCNTLAMAHSSKASKLIRLKHTKKVVENLGNVAETVDAVKAEFAATAEQYQKLLRVDVNRNDVLRYVRLCLAGTDDADKVSTRMANTIDNDVLPLLDKATNKVGGMEGTLWAAYNAVTEYFSWAAGGTGDGDNAKVNPTRKRANRMQSLWFGQNHGRNTDALALATSIADERLAV